MIKLILKQHPDDSEMIEIRQEQTNKSILVFAVAHCDMVLEDEAIRDLLRAGHSVTVKLELEHGPGIEH